MLLKRYHQASMKGLLKRSRMQTHLALQRAHTIRKDSSKQIRAISLRELLLIGTALYWEEGYKRTIIKNGKEKTYHRISFSNSDHNMIKLFMLFLKKVLGVYESKVKLNLRIFKHINEENAISYWQAATGLSRQSFQKVYYGISKSSMGKRPF